MSLFPKKKWSIPLNIQNAIGSHASQNQMLAWNLCKWDLNTVFKKTKKHATSAPLSIKGGFNAFSVQMKSVNLKLLLHNQCLQQFLVSSMPEVASVHLKCKTALCWMVPHHLANVFLGIKSQLLCRHTHYE